MILDVMQPRSSVCSRCHVVPVWCPILSCRQCWVARTTSVAEVADDQTSRTATSSWYKVASIFSPLTQELPADVSSLPSLRLLRLVLNRLCGDPLGIFGRCSTYDLLVPCAGETESLCVICRCSLLPERCERLSFRCFIHVGCGDSLKQVCVRSDRFFVNCRCPLGAARMCLTDILYGIFKIDLLSHPRQHVS